MTDYFQTLGLPRLPWLETEAINKQYLELSRLWHPDKFHTAEESEKQKAEEKYSEINQANQIISNHSSRIRHLLTLESNSPPSVVEQLPNEVMDLFMSVEKILKQFEGCIKEKESLTNPILKMGVVKRAMDLSDLAQSVLDNLNHYQSKLMTDLKALSAKWDQKNPSELLDSLEGIYRSLTHIEKWIQKLNEKKFQAQMP